MTWTSQQFKESYKQKKEALLLLLGGKCVKCGTQNDLHFHHKDPTSKKYNVTELIRYKQEILLVELNKCELLCENCHKLRHQHVIQHGTTKTYWYGCRCDLCTEAVRNYVYYRKSIRKPNGEVLGCNPK